MKQINLFFNLIILSFFIIGGGCKDGQIMPELNNKNTTPPIYDDNSPKISVGIDQVVNFSFDDKNSTRALVIGQESAQSSGLTYQIPKIKWNVGDKFRFYATIRYVNQTSQNDWRPNFSNDGMYIEIISYDANTNTGKFKIKGNINIKTEYIDNSGSSPKFIDPEKWYFGGFIGGKLNADGSAIADDMGVKKLLAEDGKSVKGITITSPNKFIAVSPSAKDFEMNVPIGIPLEKISLTGSKNSVFLKSFADKPLKLRPIGNVFCLRLKNELVHTVAIPESAKIRLQKSRFFFDSNVQLDMWHYQKELSKVGTDRFSFHYDMEGGAANKLDNDYRKPVDMAIDWTMYKPIKLGTDVLLRMNETVNLYVWSIYNTDYNNASPDGSGGVIDVDFTGLNLKVPEYTPVDERKPQTEFKSIEANSSKVKFYGGVDASSNTWQNDYPGLDVDYLRKTTKQFNLKPGSSIVVPFSIKSDLYISEIYYSWKSNKDCYSILEIFNPNSTEADLSNYFLLRIVDYPGLSDGFFKDKTKLKFWGPGGYKTDRFQNAYIMPLDFQTKTGGNVYAFTPAGYATKDMVYHDPNDVNNGIKTDDSKRFKVKSLLYAPSTSPIDYTIKKMPAGFCFCIGGHGIYKYVKEDNREVSWSGLFSGNELGGDQSDAVKMYTKDALSMKPRQYAQIYGVIDGITDMNENPSSTDRSGGSMVRDSNEGWALVKLIDGKFYIIDSFGPTFNTNDRSLSPGEFKEIMNQYRTYSDWSNASMWFERKQNVVFPNGGIMEGFYLNSSQKSLTQWNILLAKPNQGPRNHSIGSRARYYNKSGRVGNGSVPYLFGIDMW